jgi:hypothetical protein
MPDLGTIGTEHVAVKRSNGFCSLQVYRSLVCAGAILMSNSRRNDTEGFPIGPSLDISSHTCYRFRWAMDSGARTISCYVKHPSDGTPRPTLVVKANPAIGINADVTGTASSSTGWVQIGPITVNPTSDGATWVELWNNRDAQVDHCYFDTIQTT